MKHKKSLLSSKEKLLAILTKVLFSFFGGFLFGEYYRQSEMPDKAKKLKKFFMIGVVTTAKIL